jgi:4,4'-diaponeurosporenoate glycosyltransferase
VHPGTIDALRRDGQGRVTAVDAAVVTAGLAAGGWLLGAVRTVGARAGRADPGVRVSIVVPARDEAATLPALLRSVAALDPAPHEVIVVDDGSTDGTAAVARSAGAAVVTAPEPPAGWLGKPWACHLGAQAATGSHLLFLDADTWLAPDALDRLVVEHALAGGLLSVQPHHVTEQPYEQLSAVFNVVAMMGTGAFTPRPSASSSAAFGPCLLTSVADYVAVGGHAAVRSEIIEDVRLARRYRACGLAVRCLAGGDAVRFRMYPGGPGQLVEGWTKNIAAGAGTARPGPLLGAVAWVTALALVAIRTLTGLAGGGAFPTVAVAAWALVALQLRWMLRRIGRFRWWTAVAFPVPLAAFVAIFARSLLVTLAHRPVTWRRRTVFAGAQDRAPAKTERG